ncbi:MAG: flagellin [Selenomonas sp.]|nr:flagellin [Selenomonas sp.]
MQIMNNGAMMAALGELKKNDTTLGKELKKVASGMKVNGAGDGASEYAISEKMRVRLRSLGQDIVNAQTGKALVKTAMGGIESIQDNLREMKAMAINAANDHNTDADRATLQKEFDQRKEQINDIAATTNYNGKILLDGRYGVRYATTASTSEAAATPMPDINPNDIMTNQQNRIDDILQSDLAVTGSSPYTMPTNAATYTTDADGNVTVTSSGIFTLPVNNETASVQSITIDSTNVRFFPLMQKPSVPDHAIRSIRLLHQIDGESMCL